MARSYVPWVISESRLRDHGLAGVDRDAEWHGVRVVECLDRALALALVLWRAERSVRDDDRDEYVGVALEALWVAVQQYRPGWGFFTSYAWQKIRWALLDLIRDRLGRRDGGRRSSVGFIWREYERVSPLMDDGAFNGFSQVEAAADLQSLWPLARPHERQALWEIELVGMTPMEYGRSHGVQGQSGGVFCAHGKARMREAVLHGGA